MLCAESARREQGRCELAALLPGLQGTLRDSQVSYSPNSLKGDYLGDYTGSIKGPLRVTLGVQTIAHWLHSL